MNLYTKISFLKSKNWSFIFDISVKSSNTFLSYRSNAVL